MTRTSYCIACKDRSGDSGELWLGGVQDESGAYWCDVEAGVPQPGANEFWSIVALPGTDACYLSNDSAQLYACFSPNDKRVSLRPLDPFDPSFVIRLDNVGDGWVAINNGAKDQVFDAEGTGPKPGTPVIQYTWNGGDNQRWQFIDANIILALGPGDAR